MNFTESFGRLKSEFWVRLRKYLSRSKSPGLDFFSETAPETDIARLRVLLRLYKETAGDVYQYVNIVDVGEKAGYDSVFAQKLCRLLHTQGLITLVDVWTPDGMLSPQGLSELKLIMAGERDGTKHFKKAAIVAVMD